MHVCECIHVFGVAIYRQSKVLVFQSLPTAISGLKVMSFVSNKLPELMVQFLSVSACFCILLNNGHQVNVL